MLAHTSAMKWHMRLLLIVIVAVLASQVSTGQHVHPAAPTGSPAQLSVIVDGAKSPDQIPDDLAYQHFFIAVSVPAAPSALEKARQAAQFLPIQLSPVDQEVVGSAVTIFRDQFDQIEAAIAKLANTNLDPSLAAQIVSLRTQQKGLAGVALASIRKSITPDGAGRLDQHINAQVKTHIVIYGSPK